MKNRQLFAAASLLIFIGCVHGFGQYKYEPPPQLNDGIRVGTLKDAGLDEAKIVEGTNQILDGTFTNIHSLLIFRRGRLVYENYFTGEDVERGVGALGVVTHTRDTLHDMRSVTKSVVALAVLHAVTTGKIKNLDEPVFDIFPEYAVHAEGDKKLITIRHLLTMSSGLEWDEEISYADPKNSEIQMNNSMQPIEFVLKQKLTSTPGTVFNYSGGSTQLLAEIVKKKTGAPVDDYVVRNIFTPLGISAFKWVKINAGQPSAASGLRLRSRDMAKLGLLVMNGGKWNGKRIVSSRLIAEATSKRMEEKIEPFEILIGLGYGYQIWVRDIRLNGVPTSVGSFQGNGGQLVIMDPVNDLMMVTTAGNYNNRSRAKTGPFWLFPNVVFPAIIRKGSAATSN